MVRPKKRHILYRYYFEPNKTLNLTRDSLRRNLLQLMRIFTGSTGVSQIRNNFFIGFFSAETRTFSVSVSFMSHRLLMKGIACIRAMENVPISLRVLHVSGSIKGNLRYLKQEYLREVEELIKTSQNAIQEKTLKDEIAMIRKLKK